MRPSAPASSCVSSQKSAPSFLHGLIHSCAQQPCRCAASSIRSSIACGNPLSSQRHMNRTTSFFFTSILLLDKKGEQKTQALSPAPLGYHFGKRQETEETAASTRIHPLSRNEYIITTCHSFSDRADNLSCLLLRQCCRSIPHVDLALDAIHPALRCAHPSRFIPMRIHSSSRVGQIMPQAGLQ